LITEFGEFRPNNKFGNIVWDHDFSNIYNINLWKDQVAKSLIETILNQEKRLVNVKVTVEIMEEEFQTKDDLTFRRIKRRVDVVVSAKVNSTNEPFRFQELLYTSPIWID
jgi:hypothetical protein